MVAKVKLSGIETHSQSRRSQFLTRYGSCPYMRGLAVDWKCLDTLVCEALTVRLEPALSIYSF